jgi:hypothetical protein
MPTPKDRPMRLALPALLATAALALVPAAAQAKEVVSARACDADACRTITDAGALRAMSNGDPTDPPSQAAPFYRVRMKIQSGDEGGFRYRVSYVPSSGLLLVRGERGSLDWMELSAAGRAGFDRLVEGLRPVRASELGGITPPEGRPLPPAGRTLPSAGGDASGEWWTLGTGGAAALLLAGAWIGHRRRRVGPMGGLSGGSAG